MEEIFGSYEMDIVHNKLYRNYFIIINDILTCAIGHPKINF